MPKYLRYRVSVTIQQSQSDGPPLKVEVGGLVHIIEGTVDKVGAMLFEAEQHGNAGGARIHISLNKDII